MAGKRDSFKLLSSSGSSKDQLHTLLEEEEEEEEDASCRADKDPQDALPSPTDSSEEPISLLTPAASETVARPAQVRPRPATLNLRPLSLTPDKLGSSGLPTPTLTPGPRPGLRLLALASTPLTEDATPDSQRGVPTRRPPLNLSMDSLSDTSSQTDENKPVRRSSISYRRSQSGSGFAGLPTPEMTPVLSRRCSVSESIRSSRSGDEDFFPAHPSHRPLSVSEQHFLYKSHTALLMRITDLEKALSIRRTSMSGYSTGDGSRPTSTLSDTSLPSEVTSPGSSEPSDEMLALVRDLKAERDELKKDVDGWRVRVADLDKQLVLVASRAENERKEAWLARSRVGLLDGEKAELVKRMEALDKVVAGLEEEKLSIEQQNLALKEEVAIKDQRIEALEEELQKAKHDLEVERAGKAMTNDICDGLTTPTPQTFNGQAAWSAGLGFGASSADDASFNFGQGTEMPSDEEDCLAGYEDEEDSDFDPDASTFDTLNKVAESPMAPPVAPARPSHRPQRSLSKTWTFPKPLPVVCRPNSSHKRTESADKFFGCLDDSDTSDDSGPFTPMVFNYEESKDLFASGFKYADDHDAPFYLPDGVGTIVDGPEHEGKNERSLAVVAEEAEEEDSLTEEDDDMFGEAGGIRIIFTPPDDVEEEKEVEQLQFSTPMKVVSTPPTLPALDFGHDEDEDLGTDTAPFSFGRAPVVERPSLNEKQVPQQTSPRQSTPPINMTASAATPRSASRTASPPSSIPRLSTRVSTNSPPRPVLACKRPSGTPSFIPQPIASSSPPRVATPKAKGNPSPPKYFRQPLRKGSMIPLGSDSNTSKPHTNISRNGSAPWHANSSNCTFD